MQDELRHTGAELKQYRPPAHLCIPRKIHIGPTQSLLSRGLEKNLCGIPPSQGLTQPDPYSYVAPTEMCKKHCATLLGLLIIDMDEFRGIRIDSPAPTVVSPGKSRLTIRDRPVSPYAVDRGTRLTALLVMG